MFTINFLKFKPLYYIFTGILIIVSITSLCLYGLKFGIDFTGGSILEVVYVDDRPSNQQIKETLTGFELGEIYVQPTGDKGIIIRMKDVNEDTHQQIIQKLKEKNNLEERRFESIGPVVSQELRDKTITISLLSFLAIVIYIALAFRKVSFPLASWKYGFVSLLSLVHDVLIPLGVFSVLGKFYGVQVTIPIIVALLTVIGYSINNTVIVFDRIRENLLIKGVGKTYAETVNISLIQTFSRNINTSLTALFVLFAIFFFGGETLKYFALAMIIGVSAGVYSSLFLVGPILDSWLKMNQKKN